MGSEDKKTVLIGDIKTRGQRGLADSMDSG